MISVVGVYNDVEFIINKENGFFDKGSFDSTCWVAQLNFLNWLTGGTTGLEMPEEYISQKNRDWINPFMVNMPTQVTGGFIQKPSDYYLFDSIIKLNKKRETGPDGSLLPQTPNEAIDLLESSKFEERANTFVEELKPSKTKPIARLSVSSTIEFEPSDAGSVNLRYIRYPNKTVLRTVTDPVFNDNVPDEATSTHFEWGEYARPHLIWFIVNAFSDHTREDALKKNNLVSPNKPQ